MKEETKKKLCKISKIVGLPLLSALPFGALCAAMLIGNGSKKDDIKTLDNSLVQNEVRSERNIKPRKAIEDNTYLISEVGFGGEHIAVENLHTFRAGASVVWSVYGLNSSVSNLPFGYYVANVNEGGRFNLLSGGSDSWSAFNDAVAVRDYEGGESLHSWVGDNLVIVGTSLEQTYFYYDGSKDFYFEYFGNLVIQLVDTLEIPPSSSISFPESFSPLGLFGDSVTNNGGYVYLPNASGNELDIEITGLIFKYGGVVYDGIHIECVRALSMGYINDDGQLVKQGGANDYMWALSWIKFYQRYKGQSPQDGIVVVMAELKSVTDNANDMPVAFTGRTQWVNRSDRTIQIIDDLGTITGRYDGRYSDMTDKKLMEWVSSSFSVGNALGVMGNNSVFDIFTNAFDSVLPILSIAILPNITLGMLLFIPLIGAIIVIIIRVVKK